FRMALAGSPVRDRVSCGHRSPRTSGGPDNREDIMRALMRSTAFALLIGLSASVGACMHQPSKAEKAEAGKAAAGSAYAAAIGDAARPQADKDRDADRKPVEMLTFAGVKPGQKIGELLPGGGYFSRIFSKAVGPSGKVYA